jgi:hypothetical protein
MMTLLVKSTSPMMLMMMNMHRGGKGRAFGSELEERNLLHLQCKHLQRCSNSSVDFINLDKQAWYQPNS